MPEIKCANCGRTTNTAVSDHIRNREGKADGCYLAFDPEVWSVRGCWYERAPEYMKRYVDKMIEDNKKHRA